MEEQIAGELSSQPYQIYQSQSRLFFLDLLKALSMVAVVSYYSIFLPKSTYAENAFFIDMLFAPLRFCVPMLFTISFLLFERGWHNKQLNQR
jgi:surface polysaccharide O-acyltransferase-like enzyme